MTSTAFRVTAAGLAVALAVAGCSAGATTDPGGPGGQAASRSAAATEPVSLRGSCPETVVIQTNWWPQAEDGGLYRLLGADLRVDTGAKRVSAPLVAGGVDTGVRLELRSGGPANSFTPAARALYLDRSVLLGTADIDQVAQLSGGDQPVRAVFAALDKSPVVLLWDPARHPQFHTIADIGRTGTRVVYFPGAAYMDYLTGTGKLRKAQVEASYDGTPARFVAERGAIVQQGFLTNEVYQYEHELPQWKKKVAWALVNDAGYPNYAEALVIRPDRAGELAGCLRRLVPILQRSLVDYARDPAATNELLVRLVRDFGAFPYSTERARNAVDTMLRNGLFGDGGNGAVGDFDTARLTQMITAVRPVAAAAGTALPAGLGPEDLATNEFIDTSISLAR